MGRDGTSSDPFFTGGALPPDSLSYVERPADNELFDSVLVGKLCCIFAPHHMGKSSLMLRTARRLEQRGIRTITADLATLSADSSIVQSLQYLTMCLKHQLKLSVDPVTWWWVEQAYSDPTRGIVDFLRDEVLGKVEEPVAIFLDGIDTTLNSDILDSLLTAIRLMYQARETDLIWRRLTFTLLGSASLDDLIRNHSQFPFRDCQSIDLREFSPDEAQVLQQALQAACPTDSETVFSRIFYWTNGHPYLTQKLCIAAATAQHRDCTNEWVDGLVNTVFLPPRADSEPNLRYVKDSIRMSKRRRQLLSCYRRVYEGKKVPEDEHSFAQNRLKLLGLVRGESGTLKVRNELYRLTFDSAWIEANMKVSWTLRIAAVVLLLILLLVGFANLSFSQQQQIPEAQAYIDSLRVSLVRIVSTTRQQIPEAQTYIDSFRNTSDPDERLISLAGLLKLGGHDDEARRLFYEELSPADQLALFQVARPRTVGEQLINVVKGIYTDPRLKNNEQSNAMLGAMAQPLTQLNHSASLGAAGLELEIRLWLKGREYYNADGQYQEAIHSYDIAISLSDRNPGTYFDRAEAYIAQGKTSQALADFAKAVSLDERWREPVQEALMGDAQLYAALERDPGEHAGLLALIPTSTSTLAPTNTPTASPTPSPTPLPPTATLTETSVPPTATPTATATAAPTATPTTTPTFLPPTATPTKTSVPSTSTPTATATATPTATATATSTAAPTATPTTTPTSRPPTATPTKTSVLPTATATATATPTPTATATATSTAAPTATPTTTPTSRPPTATATATATPTVPSGTFTLLEPISLDDPTHGPTDFVWEWTGSVPSSFGFEVRVWREGESPVGAHDALLDNQSGNIQNIGGQEYRLNTNIEGAAGVAGRSGVYSWTVALVQVSPGYADLGQQAEPAQLRLEILSASDGEDPGGGVGID